MQWAQEKSLGSNGWNRCDGNFSFYKIPLIEVREFFNSENSASRPAAIRPICGHTICHITRVDIYWTDHGGTRSRIMAYLEDVIVVANISNGCPMHVRGPTLVVSVSADVPPPNGPMSSTGTLVETKVLCLFKF